MANDHNDHSDFNTLPNRADRARGAIRNLSSAFEDLSKNGTLTSRAVNSLANAMGAIPHPGAQVASLGIQIGSAILGAAEAAEEFKRKQLAEEFKRVQDEIERGLDSVRAFRDAMLSGDTTLDANVKQRIQNIRDVASASERAIEAGIVSSRDQIAKWKQEQDLYVAGQGRWLVLGTAIAEMEAHIRAEQSRSTKVMADASDEIRLLLGRFDDYTGNVRKAEKATKDFSDSLKGISVTDTIGGPEQEASIQRNIDLYYQWAAAGRMVSETLKEQAGEHGMMFAADAYNAYADALDKTVSLNQLFAGGFDRAMRNVAASSIRSVGQRAAVDAAYETAKGIAAIAIGDPMAPVHFKAAAAFAAIALAAGAGSGLVSVAPGGGGFSSGGGRGGRESGGREGRGTTINLTVIGAPDFTTKQTIAQWVHEIEAEAG